MNIYLDCAATAPVEPAVAGIIKFYTEEEFGNAGSRTHEFGTKAKQAVQKAREQVAAVVGVDAADVIFTSGATESNNISILGMLDWAKENNKNHIVTTAIEHKAVLEPILYAQSLGFKVDFITPDESGAVSVDAVLSAVRDDTCLVSVMQVNNETGVIQPIAEIATGLPEKGVYFHVDAAQGFGKELEVLRDPRIDLISISGHKIYGPKGIGALIMRRRKYKRAPLKPITFGGGQERGLRPGTLPVPLVAGLGLAGELAQIHNAERTKANQSFRASLLDALSGLDYEQNGDESLCVPSSINISFKGINSEALMLALKGFVAISNGSACTSQNYELSHVLKAMGLSDERIQSAVRLSWCHMTEEPDWDAFRQAVLSLR